MGDNWFFLGDGMSQRASELSWTLMHMPRQIPGIRLMRIPFYSSGGALKGEPGHYWIEIDHGSGKGEKESYGWYPAPDLVDAEFTGKTKGFLSMFTPFFEAEGCINGDSPARRAAQDKNKQGPIIAGGGIGTKPFPWDPHHGSPEAVSIRYPYVGLGDHRTDNEIIEEVRAYAAGYKSTSNGLWTYKFDDPAENNCHTFMWQTLYHCKLIDVDILTKAVDPHFYSFGWGGVPGVGGAVSQAIAVFKRPAFVEFLTDGAKQINKLLKEYGV